ncbi:MULTISPECIES: RNA-guided endonuclease InsQ/TnpB family protein [unclassified Microcoleus]|uniref:RNA-guided endonuclease InsQ/TnpB family protein n=1 Tax=unclassified Microcoleus TaxID=2642155 RepID=UPI002FD02FC5
MRLSYQYRIQPTPKQQAVMFDWLELLRRHRNWVLGNRFDWLHRTRCKIDRCSIVSEPIGEIPELKPTFENESAQLKETKKLFPEYKEFYHEVQQENLKRVDKAWSRWLIPDKNGNRGGRPKFKKKGELRSFTFSRVNNPKSVCFLEGTNLRIPKLGLIPVIVHRPIPQRFEIKTATIVYKADGWYVSLSLLDDSVPEPLAIDAVKSVVGVDVGLKEFLTTSDGETVPIQQHYRRTQKHLAGQQRQLSRKKPGSNQHKKQQNKVARIHQRIARNRKDFHYKTAYQLTRKYDLIAVEDLKVRNLARNSRLAKSILDAGWSAFINILESVAVKCGSLVVKVAPHNTSQNCSGCQVLVPKTLSVRTHECPNCGLILDRDENAAVNILNKALQAVGHIVSARGGQGDTQPVKRETSTGWDEVQLSLF